MKICPKCDSQNANNAAVCKNCGASLNDVPDLSDVVADVEQKSRKPAVAFLCALVSFAASASKGLLPLESEDVTSTHYILYFIGCAVSIIFLVFCALLLRGIFKKKSIPAIGLAAVLLGIVCLIMVILDVLSLPATIADFRALF
ncbi:MAG: hypothetical protein J5750_06750 [Clostridiales bacterium]|nr:hypothetical protein [Clostridiales bacterium]